MGIGTGLTPGSLAGKPVSTSADQSRSVERETGIEPVSLAWKAKVLPLNYSRPGSLDPRPTPLAGHRLWWRRLDSNQRTQCGQIYSLLPLTTRPPLLRQARNYSTGSPGCNRSRRRAAIRPATELGGSSAGMPQLTTQPTRPRPHNIATAIGIARRRRATPLACWTGQFNTS